MIARNDPCFCGSGKKWKKCHYPVQPSLSVDHKSQYLRQYGIIIKTPEQIEGIKRACQLAASILDKTCQKAKTGVSTEELNTYAEKLHTEAGAIAAPLGYGHPPFPKSICTSLNEEICHGIPDKSIILQEGDFLNIDVSCILDGYYGDCSKMVAIGTLDKEKQNVMETAKACLDQAISIVKPGLLLYQIGDVIEEVAAKTGCSVVNQFVGHGVGVEFHEPPQILHHKNNLKIPLVPGMTFTIEPMINAGVRDCYIDENNHWTAYTNDGKPSAQWEHTLLVTEQGHEILTQSPQK